MTDAKWCQATRLLVLRRLRRMRKKRGETPYAAFARKLGITRSSLFRLENGQQSITLKTLQEITDPPKYFWSDVFPAQS
ncbi:MAG: helix-turn-helix domain-containing protein [Limisphaerales bacterium]